MRLTQQQLEAHLWGAANILRGKTAGQDYKNYILSLMFYKRLCDQWENEADEAIAELERQQGRTFTEAQKAIFRARGEHRFAIPEGARWGDVLAVSEDIGAKLTNAMRAISDTNDELRGVFTVDWNQPAPDGSAKKLIPNEVVHALIQHFDEVDLSNKSVPPDILGRAYEYLIKQFADDAGAKAGEFFTPPEVVDTLVRMLEPQPGDMIYDPTCGSGGMLIHSADFLKGNGYRPDAALYFGQEMNWGNSAIGKINSVLHGLDADIRGGASTITDPQFLDHGQVKKFSLVLANFPFSDDFWWLKPEQQTDDKKKKDRLKKEVFGKEGYKDPYSRFGRGTGFHSPPASYGDYAFILHILASLTDAGRAGVVCPQGVLFRGQPEVEEETGEFDSDGNPKLKRRKADDEHLIRQALLESRLIDAVISLPLNVFYGAGVPACLIILRKQRPAARRDQVLLVYAARHYRELSAKNELRPQDVMRILVHYHAYGDAETVPALVAQHSQRIRMQISQREQEEVERLEAEYQGHAERLAQINAALAAPQIELFQQSTSAGKKEAKAALKKLESQRARPAAKVAERDERIAEARRRTEDDRQEVAKVGEELIALYDSPDELLKHARVVSLDEIAENEFNLNIPRYVDTFEPEPSMEVDEILEALEVNILAVQQAETNLRQLLSLLNYGVAGKQKQTSKRPTHWQDRRVAEVAEVESGITLGKDVSGFKYVELPYLRVANVQDGHLDLTTIKMIKVRLDEVERYLLEAGDVLMTEGGDIDKLGRGTLWEGQIPNCLHQNHIFRIRANRAVLDPRFFALVVESDIAKSYFLRVAKRTTNLASINKTQVRAFRFPVPPVPEQERIVEIVAAAKVKLQSLMQQEKALHQLKTSLMHDLLTGKVRVNHLNLDGVPNV